MRRVLKNTSTEKRCLIRLGLDRVLPRLCLTENYTMRKPLKIYLRCPTKLVIGLMRNCTNLLRLTNYILNPETRLYYDDKMV